MEPTGTVTFTVKELLERLDLKLDQVNNKLDLKADMHDLEDLRRVVATKADAHDLVDLRRDVDSVADWRNRLAGGLVVVVVIGAANAARLWFGL